MNPFDPYLDKMRTAKELAAALGFKCVETVWRARRRGLNFNGKFCSVRMFNAWQVRNPPPNSSEWNKTSK